MTNKPPAWIGVGDIEILFYENMANAERRAGAGVLPTLEVVPGAPNGVERFGASTETASAYLRQAPEWVGQTIAACPR